MRKLLTLLIAFILVVAVVPTFVFAAYGDGTSFDWAVNMSFGSTYTKYWTSSNDHLYHYAKFTAPSRGIVTFKMEKPHDDEGEVCSLEVSVIDEYGNDVYGNTGRHSRSNPRSYYQYSFGVAPGTYYISIDPNFSVKSGLIDMYYGVTFEATDYAEIESNESASNATKMTLGKTYTGFFGNEYADTGEFDYWKFDTVAGKTYRVTFEDFGHLDATSTMLESSFGISSYSVGKNIDGDGNNYYEFEATNTGTQYFWLDNYSSTQVRYDVRVDDMSPPDVGDIKDLEAESKTTSVKLSWDKVKDATGYRIWVYNSKESKWEVKKTTSSNSYTHSSLKKKTTYKYAIQAYQNFGGKTYYGEYSYIDATTAMAKLESLKASSTTSSVKLSWKKVSGADGYQIYRYESGKYKKIDTVKGTSFTDSKRSAGTTYTYRVRAYDKSGSKTYYSTYEKIKLATKPKNVSGLKGTAKDTSITLKWTKLSGATGYQIQLYDSSAKKYKDLKNTSSTSYTAKSLSPAKTYTFRVRAYKTVEGKKYYSNEYKKLKVTTALADVTSFKADTTKSTVKLSWKKVSGASGYEIYLYNSSKGEYKKLTSTSKTSYSHKELSAGKTYTYRIRAYKTTDGKKNYGDYTKLKVSTLPKAVSGITANSALNSVELSWKKVSGADGYQIYLYDYNTESYKKVTDTTATAYTHSGLNSGASCTYRIRAYRTVEGKKYYGEYTKVKTSTQLEALTGLTAETTASAVDLSWNSVPGADGYVVTVYDPDTDSQVTVTETSAVTAKGIKVNPGEIYNYSVYAYKKYDGKKYVSEAASVRAITPPGAVQNLAADTSALPVMLTWDAVPGADSYMIYSYNAYLAEWQENAFVTDNFFISKETVSGKVIRYRVCACKRYDDDIYYGEKSSVITVQIP